MMKKKNKQHKETMQNNRNKMTDNKETNNNPENINDIITDIDSDVDSKNYTLENGNDPVPNSDNNAQSVRVVEEKLAEMQDKYIRLSAEFDNYRKRTLREKMDLSKYAGESLLLNLIPIIDDFERALKHMDSATDSAALKGGIDLIYVKFSEFLKQNGVKEIEALNTNFNVDIHEAVAKTQVQEDDKKGKVVDVLQKGYYLQDKVLRFAKVVVGE
jgi:molecular chaperone GrpE